MTKIKNCSLMGIGAFAKAFFAAEKAKSQLLPDTRTKSTLGFPRFRFTFFSSKIAALRHLAEFPIAVFASVLLFLPSSLSANAQKQDIHHTPQNGINADWPILTEREYFTHRGRNARSVTLGTVMAFGCHKIMDLYDDDPQLAFDDLELLILVQFALRGLDIQTMDPSKREAIALSEISKRLRQFGRLAEVRALFQKPRVIPSVAGLCQVLAEQKEDMLRQKYHVKHRWDLHKVDAKSSAP